MSAYRAPTVEDLAEELLAAEDRAAESESDGSNDSTEDEAESVLRAALAELAHLGQPRPENPAQPSQPAEPARRMAPTDALAIAYAQLDLELDTERHRIDELTAEFGYRTNILLAMAIHNHQAIRNLQAAQNQQAALNQQAAARYEQALRQMLNATTDVSREVGTRQDRELIDLCRMAIDTSNKTIATNGLAVKALALVCLVLVVGVFLVGLLSG